MGDVPSPGTGHFLGEGPHLVTVETCLCARQLPIAQRPILLPETSPRLVLRKPLPAMHSEGAVSGIASSEAQVWATPC